ncbi:hypothetical protein T440DRAFT_481150 [Plenodomus tracheiphilus IPT5]|uniref:BZIP domain-containing protein n=1 Tax=Plenodomus tracheiphilus IPT5 TaxID=1408161 RepID=A0A6A7B143_9PLEO|nr:hypothetical protein T440DRAFT_481150 [Plenodomus tracheiphilus IPT5]
MSSETQAPLKRGRTASSKSRGFESPSEELSHVANLVERRRVQNRISQRNYRNKIRNRLEKLEAMVETSKAQRSPSAHSPSASGETIEAGPSNPPNQDHTMRDSPPSTVPHTCMCTFRDAELLGLSGEDFETACSCGGVEDVHRSLSESLSPFSTFVDTTGPDSMFINLPSPESLHCNTPTTTFQEDFLQLGSVSAGSSLSEHTTNSASHSREASLVSLDQPRTPPIQQPYERSSFPFHVPMGYQMVPMSYAAPADRIGGQPWSPTPMNYPPGIRPVMPSTSMPHYILVPTPMMMVPMQHSIPSQHQGPIQPPTRP